MLSYPLLGFVYFYKYAISPLTPASCRHVPTCSNYMIEAIKVHGPLKGFWLGIKRLSKCHPWGTHGYDPIPPKKMFETKKMNMKNLKKKN
ncbi:MAG: membrane protein insertion efficiency factor YidD [Prolixibacteraceae bacterium]|nr:membrane protein insertion efficiency factor YidD [Prolixibacteraceae bacterium]